MFRSGVLASAVAVALLSAAPAVAQPSQAQSVTATGTGQVRVVPKNRHNNASIAAAVDAAHKDAITGALSDAHEYALDYARGAGLTLGGVISVSDANSGGFYIGPGPFGGPFGPDQYCGTVRQVVGKPKRGKPTKTKTVHRCIVPQFAFASLTVTYAAS